MACSLNSCICLFFKKFILQKMNITIPASFWTQLFGAVQGVVILTHWAYISCYTEHTICKETL